MPAPSRDSPTVVSGAAVPETGTLRSAQAQSTQMSERESLAGGGG